MREEIFVELVYISSPNKAPQHNKQRICKNLSFRTQGHVLSKMLHSLTYQMIGSNLLIETVHKIIKNIWLVGLVVIYSALQHNIQKFSS